MHTKSYLNTIDVDNIVKACKQEAERNAWKVTIAVVDEAGYLLQLVRLDGAPLPSVDIATGKARTAAMARTATKTLEDTVKERPALLSFPNRVPVQGGIPLIYKGECIGGIGVSGVKSHEDEQVAVVGSKALPA